MKNLDPEVIIFLYWNIKSLNRHFWKDPFQSIASCFVRSGCCHFRISLWCTDYIFWIPPVFMPLFFIFTTYFVIPIEISSSGIAHHFFHLYCCTWPFLYLILAYFGYPVSLFPCQCPHFSDLKLPLVMPVLLLVLPSKWLFLISYVEVNGRKAVSS